MTGVMKLAVLVVVLSIWTYNPVQPASLFSAFSQSFGEQEEITYRIVREGNGYEERLYPSKNWLCTKQKGGYSDGDQISVFTRLFGYLEGDNDQKRHLKMGIPVSIEYEKKPTEEVFTACFFLEEKDQVNYPTPNNPEVTIVQRPELTIFTKRFGGYATSQSDWLNQADELKVILQKAGEQTRSDIMYWNAYNSPFKFWNRRNEVWLVKE